MSIKKTIIVTAAILASVAMVAPTLAGATTISDMMAQISALQAQLSTLQGGTPVPTGGVLCNGVTFTRNLVVGSTGSDVKCLQVLLNANGYTLAATGAGSPGNETSTFGPRTLVAVKAFQAAKGMTPANQVGPLTRAALNALLGTGTYYPPVTQLPAGCTSTAGFSPTTGASCATGVIINNTGSISAILAYDNPPAGALISSEASADLLHINFTGTGTVTSVTLQRTGISDQNTLTNVYLYDGNTRITDGYSFNINGQLVMNGLSIAVNGSKVISVKADTEAAVYNTSSSIAIALIGFTGNGSATSANVQGNTQMLVTGTAATAYLGANSLASVSTAATEVTLNAGTTQYTVWSAPLQINTRAVSLKMANFKMVGSAPTNVLANIRLFIDGVDTGKVATVIAIQGSSYASFDLTSAPITLTTGSHTMDVRSDVVSGASRTIQLSIQQAADLTITDPQVGVNIAALGASGASFTANLGAYISINTGSGSVVVDPTFTSATNVAAGATNAVIGRFILHGYGEDVKVTSINVTPALSAEASSSFTYTAAIATVTCTAGTTAGFVAGNAVTSTGGGIGIISSIDSATQMKVAFSVAGSSSGTITVADKGLNNVTLYFNGSQIGSTQSPTALGTPLAFTLGSQMILPAGQDSTLEVRADLQQQSTTTAYGAGTIIVTLPAETAANAQGQSSQNTVSVPAGAVATTGLSISSATLAVSKNNNFTSQPAAPNTANVKIGSFSVQNQSTSESVRLTTLTVNLTTDGSTPLTTQLTGISSLRTSDTTGSGSIPIQPSAANTFSVNDTLAPGAQMTIDIFANLGSAATLPAVVTRLTVASIGVSSNIVSAGTIQTGQTMTLGTGIIGIPAIIVSSTTPSQYIASGASGAANASQAAFSFVSTGGAATIQELKFGVMTGDGTVTNVCLGAVCASPVAGVADLTGLNLSVPGSGSLTQNVQVSYASVSTYGLASVTASKIGLIYMKYVSGGTTSVACPNSVTPAYGTAVTCTNTDTGDKLSSEVDAYAVSLVGSVPTVTVNQTATATGLNLGATNKIGQVTVAASAQGEIRVRQIKFNVTSSSFYTTTMTLVGTTPTIRVGSTAVTGATCTTDNATEVTCALGTTYATDYIISAGQSQTFNLYAQVNGAAVSGTKASVSTSLSAADFIWDDSSWNGSTADQAHGVALLGLDVSPKLIYNFPSDSYTVTQ